MSLKSIVACEMDQLKKYKRFQLAPHFKKVGLAVVVFGFIMLLVNRGFFDSESLRFLSKHGILIGLLLISISRDKIEDELIIKLRMTSYVVAFISAVVFSLCMPYIEYLVDAILKPEQVGLKYIGDFMILWMLLIVQILYFETLKRAYS